MKRVCILPWALLTIFVLGAGLASAESLKGKVKDHLYYSPANNFSVPVPSGAFKKWARVEDNFSSNGGVAGLPVGLVSFPDDLGGRTGIQYTRIPDQAIGKLQAAETRDAALKDWLHGEAMPLWYMRASAQSQITNERMGTFEGMPALIAVVVIPEGSSLLLSGTKKYMDSRRVLVIFPRGQFVYLLSMETVTAMGGNLSSGDQTAPNSRLASFYRSIVFQE